MAHLRFLRCLALFTLHLWRRRIILMLMILVVFLFIFYHIYNKETLQKQPFVRTLGIKNQSTLLLQEVFTPSLQKLEMNKTHLLKTTNLLKKFSLKRNTKYGVDILRHTTNRITRSHLSKVPGLTRTSFYPENIIESPYIPQIRLVHFDLKGAPPKINYYKTIFSLIKQAGATGVLMEYEDMFPYWGVLSSVKSGNSYSKEDIQEILSTANFYDLKVIPLVQTFGHLEFMLKLKEFRHLREVDDYPQALCPSLNSSFNTLQIMIDQVVSLHPDSKWLHIGSDEVYQLGVCPKCSKYNSMSLFLSHVAKVAQYVRDKHELKPIMWDDMLRQVSVETMKAFKMGSLVEPMVWVYVEDVKKFATDDMWSKYREVFPYIWTASAFKGAFGETLTVPPARRHLENNLSWLRVMNEQEKLSNSTKFRGIVLTGWQRYDHMASLCELLPAAIPSLVLDVMAVSKGYFNESFLPTYRNMLNCSGVMPKGFRLKQDRFLWRAAGVCFFSGSAVFRLTENHKYSTAKLKDYISESSRKGWLTRYNIERNFSSPMRIEELMKNFQSYNSSLQSLMDAAKNALREVYDDHTVAEWIQFQIYPYVIEMEELHKNAMALRKHRTWIQRPLSVSKYVDMYVKSKVRSRRYGK